MPRLSHFVASTSAYPWLPMLIFGAISASGSITKPRVCILGCGKVSAGELVAQLKEEGILAGAMGSKLLRFVTHMDFDDAQLEKVIKILPTLLKNSLVAK